MININNKEKDILLLCMVITYSKGKDQPGKVANPARGQLDRENEFSPVPVCAREFGLAKRVRQSRPASVKMLSIQLATRTYWGDKTIIKC